MEEYIIKDGKRLRLGYTTGSCAAAAAKAACFMLLTGRRKETVELLTPKGILLTLSVLEITQGPDFVSCAIRKDSGDDPDATRDTLIFASVRKTDAPGVFIDGGAGVGRVTKRGLDQPVGAAAINSVPRRMIEENVREVCRLCDYHGGISVIISVPGRRASCPKDVQSPPRHYRRHFHSGNKRHRRAHERAGAGRYHPRRAAPAARNRCRLRAAHARKLRRGLYSQPASAWTPEQRF